MLAQYFSALWRNDALWRVFRCEHLSDHCGRIEQLVDSVPRYFAGREAVGVLRVFVGLHLDEVHDKAAIRLILDSEEVCPIIRVSKFEPAARLRTVDTYNQTRWSGPAVPRRADQRPQQSAGTAFINRW